MRGCAPSPTRLPQLADIWVIGSDGRPVVSGTVFPMPQQMDLSDRDYFRVHQHNPAVGVHVGEVVQSRATNAQGRPRFFTLSRRRTGPNGEFAGVTTISISPDYFAEYYAPLTQPLVAALVRRGRPRARALSRRCRATCCGSRRTVH